MTRVFTRKQTQKQGWNASGVTLPQPILVPPDPVLPTSKLVNDSPLSLPKQTNRIY